MAPASRSTNELSFSRQELAPPYARPSLTPLQLPVSLASHQPDHPRHPGRPSCANRVYRHRCAQPV
ncbi:hypothetical protein B0H17DRAFT_1112014, partial [Mycena rosella]